MNYIKFKITSNEINQVGILFIQINYLLTIIRFLIFEAHNSEQNLKIWINTIWREKQNKNNNNKEKKFLI